MANSTASALLWQPLAICSSPCGIQHSSQDIVTRCFFLCDPDCLFLHGDIFPLQLEGTQSLCMDNCLTTSIDAPQVQV